MILAQVSASDESYCFDNISLEGEGRPGANPTTCCTNHIAAQFETHFRSVSSAPTLPPVLTCDVF